MMTNYFLGLVKNIHNGDFSDMVFHVTRDYAQLFRLIKAFCLKVINTTNKNDIALRTQYL